MRMRGHGVHSPFAYRFITEVIGEPGRTYAYYAYPAIRSLALKYGEQEHWLRLLFRVTAEFFPADILVDSQLTPAERKVITMASPRGYFRLPPATTAAMSVLADLPEGLQHRGTVIIKDIRRPGWSEWLDEDACSMVFTDSHQAIVVSRPDFSHQVFTVKF